MPAYFDFTAFTVKYKKNVVGFNQDLKMYKVFCAIYSDGLKLL